MGRKRSAWMAVPGLAIWAQLFLGAALGELAYADTRLMYLAAYILPLIVMAAGYWLGRIGWLQIGFMASLLPAFLVLPVEDQPGMDEPLAVIWLCGLVVLYLVMGMDWFAVESMPAEDIEHESIETAASGGERRKYVATLMSNHQQHFISRFVISLWLFGVITYAVFFDTGNQASIGEFFEGGEQVTVSFLAISMFFVWCMVVYMMIVVPTINLEYDQRRLELSTAALAQTKVRRLAGLRIFVLVLLSVAAGWAVVYLQ